MKIGILNIHSLSTLRIYDLPLGASAAATAAAAVKITVATTVVVVVMQ